MFINTVIVFDNTDSVDASFFASSIKKIDENLRKAAAAYLANHLASYPEENRLFADRIAPVDQLAGDKKPVLEITGTFEFVPGQKQPKQSKRVLISGRFRNLAL